MKLRPPADPGRDEFSPLPPPIQDAIQIGLFDSATTLDALTHNETLALAAVLRAVDSDKPGEPFRVLVTTLMERLHRSRPTVTRYLKALVDKGWVTRWQVKANSRRWGFRCAWMQLTDDALAHLFQRASLSINSSKPSPSDKGKRWVRVQKRIPKDLKALESVMTPARIVWLMAEAKAAGVRLQTILATHLEDVLTARKPAARLAHLVWTWNKPSNRPAYQRRQQAQARSGYTVEGSITSASTVAEHRQSEELQQKLKTDQQTKKAPPANLRERMRQAVAENMLRKAA
jgi:DNA-binding MarR family transcriptional regulator